MTKSFSLDALIDQLPAGLDRVVLRVISFHKGRENAIPRDKLVAAIRSSGFSKIQDRQIRACINLLRKDGHPICSAGGDAGGYWIAAGWVELDEYIKREIHSRALDLLEQERALTKTGEKLWGAQSLQKGLGI